MTANHYSLHLRKMWSSVPETVPIGVATPASKHIGVVGASLRGLFPLLMMSASGALFGSATCCVELPLSGQKADLVNSMIGAECGATACSRNDDYGMQTRLLHLHAEPLAEDVHYRRNSGKLSDVPNASCCGEADAYWADVSMSGTARPM
jgi:hypothetical protein